MAKANGWYTPSGAGARVGVGVGVAQGNGVSGVSTHLAKYTRGTELRRVEDNDIYRLATILDVNACWRKLMSIIPKGLDVQAASAAGALNYHEIASNGGLKYSAQDISLIDGVAERLPPDQSISQVMIDEWKTSGKLNERPTVGVLLQLLVQAELYSAADFVASDFLNESKPERPADGPAAHISLDLSEELAEDMEVDHDQAGSVARNLDCFDKHMSPHDKSVPQPLEQPPTAPPRSSRQIRSNATASSSTQNRVIANPITRTTIATTGATATSASASDSSSSSIPNVPNLTILNLSEQTQEEHQLQNMPNLSILNPITPAAVSMTTASTLLDVASNGISTQSTGLPNVPRITLLIENSAEVGSSPSTSVGGAPNLPEISALNLNTQQDSANSSSSTNSLSNDDDDEDEDEDPDADVSLPNLSNSDNHNSNNDSSLTTVTGTSGDNSFELTNDSSSASNEDYASNIPNLSLLQP